jgi:N-methylhydantoinase B/oxoprolinase/acetone carboxylase alpha subunit
MNATAELAHGLGNHVCSFVTQNMYMVGAKMLYGSPHREAVQAPHSRNFYQPIFSGVNRRGYYGTNMSGNTNAAGGGGRYDMDGEPALGFYWAPWADSGEVEDMDQRLSHFILARVLDKNFHGYGKYRGGTPLLEVATICGDGQCAVSSWGSCDKVTFNFGLFGGYSGPPNPRFVIKNSDVLDKLRAGEDIELGQFELLTKQKVDGDYILSSSGRNAEMFKEGDMIIHSCGAAGGYGDVLEREPEAVLKDLTGGDITDEVARKVYGVAIDKASTLVDEAETGRLRKGIRRERLAKAVTFDEFTAQWSKLKPPDKVIEHYGHWPEPRLERYSATFWGMYGNASAA